MTWRQVRKLAATIACRERPSRLLLIHFSFDSAFVLPIYEGFPGSLADGANHSFSWSVTMTARRLRFVLPAGLLLFGLMVALSQPPHAGSQPPGTDPTSGAKKAAANPNSNVLPGEWVESFTWRPIGPANMSGRIVALAVCDSDPSTWWSATASGGLLKTTNNGITFEHQFDKQATVSIGDVAVAQSDPKVVWVGTGENNPRNSVSYGDGVYMSTDGGDTWTNMGLNKTFQIGKVVIHPTNPDIVYVGALGRLYGPSEERRLFKTTDGGKTWNKIHYIDDRTGVIDMRMHPKEPDTLLVATWE